MIMMEVFLISSSMALKKISDPKNATLVKLCVILSPFVCVQYSYDVGRTDLVLFNLLIICAVAICRGRVFAACVISVIGVLVHEMYFVAMFPVSVALLFDKIGRVGSLIGKKEVLRIATLSLYVMVPAVVTFVCVKFGRSPALARFDGPSSVIIRSVMERGLFKPAFGSGGYKSAVLLVYIVSTYGYMIMTYTKNGAKLNVTFLPAIMPLLLFVFGTDSARWLSVIYSIVLFILAYYAAEKGWKLLAGSRPYCGCLCASTGPGRGARLLPFDNANP